MDATQLHSHHQSPNNDPDSHAATSSECIRTRNAIEHFHLKINRTKEAIKTEQTSRDENVNEYLKLAPNADKTQLPRIKSIFEKKNQKSAHTISHLQKKLENYYKKIKDLETHGYSAFQQHKSNNLKGVGSNIKDGIARLLTQSNTLRSDDSSVNHETTSVEGANSKQFPSCSQEDDESSSITSGSCKLGVTPVVAAVSGGASSTSPDRNLAMVAALNSTTTNDDISTHSVNLEPVMNELRERRDEVARLTAELEALKAQLGSECTVINQSLQDERYRFERLEEQMNDLVELHQNEIENLKQCIADMEEKVQYQSEERLRDVHEMLESCQTRISRMEHQQHQHLQQIVNLDSLENSNARALVLKLINVLLTILQVVLLLVATLASILTPFLNSRARMLITVIVVVLAMVFFKQWTDIFNWAVSVSDRYMHKLKFDT